MAVSRTNPFRYGEVATGDYFANRLGELAELVADVHSGQNVVIFSPRRYGKTSLVLRAVEQLKKERVLVAYVDLLRTPTRERFADHLAAAIHRGLVAPLERVWQRTLDVFQNLPLRPRITVNPDGTPAFEFAAGERAQDVERTIEGLLELPQHIATQRKQRVALILDEFQEVVGIDPHLPALMRSVFQQQGEVAHVFLGSQRHLLQRVFTDVNEPMYRLARPLLLRPISVDDFGAFIRERFVASGQRISASAVAHILSTTEGHPHDTQQLSYFTWWLAQVERVEASPTLVDRALARIVEAEDARFTTLWDSLSAHQRLVLLALVDDGLAVYSQAYRIRHRLGAHSSLQQSLERLVHREVVELSAPGRYRIPDVFLRSWLRRLAAPPSASR